MEGVIASNCGPIGNVTIGDFSPSTRPEKASLSPVLGRFIGTVLYTYTLPSLTNLRWAGVQLSWTTQY